MFTVKERFPPTEYCESLSVYKRKISSGPFNIFILYVVNELYSVQVHSTYVEKILYFWFEGSCLLHALQRFLSWI
jgi:hypothetical protein